MSKEIRIETNCVTLDVHHFAYHQYDVILPLGKGAKPPSSKTKDKLLSHLQTTVAPETFEPRLIYDRQKIAYCSKLLKFQSGNSATFIVSPDENNLVLPTARDAYQITLSVTGSIITNDDLQRWIQDSYFGDQDIRARGEAARNVLQLVMRQGPNKRHQVKNGRAYFSNLPSDVYNTGRGIEFWRGIFLSVRTSPSKILLQIDTTCTAVYGEGYLLDLALAYLKLQDVRDLINLNDSNLKQLERFLLNLGVTIDKVGPKGAPRTKRIRYLEPQGANFRFERNGREMTVAEYYLEVYNITIQYPRLFAVSLEKRNSKRQTIVPAELCKVVGGQICNRLPDEFRTGMVKFSAMTPGVRKQRIKRELDEYVNSEYMAEAGVTLGRRLLPIEAKRLDTPSVIYQNGPVNINTSNGSWNVTRSRFFEPTPVKAWGVLNTIPHQINLSMAQGYMSELMRCCTQLGMIGTSSDWFGHVTAQGGSQDAVEKGLDELLFMARTGGYQKADVIIIVLLAQNAAMPRSYVKHWGDVKRGILTQCLRHGKFNLKHPGQNNQYYNNVALKINARLGGINSHSYSPWWELQIKKKLGPFMVMGADVGHPSPGQHRPSVSGFVYSLNPTATKFAALTELQQPRQEAIQDIRAFVRKAMIEFVKTNQGHVPQNIIFFRDGLSEGEYLSVAGAELQEIKGGIQDVWQKAGEQRPMPRVTFMIVTKRHHAVFFPPDGTNPRENCPPGLVVEKHVTTHIVPNFYLQSHSAIQGTSRSSHYLVLLDEVFGQNLDSLQKFAHHLCYNYAKATRSVSIPSPVYYADLVCSRMMFHLNLATMPDEDASTSNSGDTPFNLDAWKASFQQLNPDLLKKMYFL